MPQPQPPHIDSKSVADYINSQVNGYYNNGTLAVNSSLDLGKGVTQRVVLGASGLTLALTNAKPVSASGPALAQRAHIILVQDATGSRLLPAFSPALNYGAAGAPTLTTAANKIDDLELLSLDGGTTWLCTGVVKGF